MARSTCFSHGALRPPSLFRQHVVAGGSSVPGRVFPAAGGRKLSPGGPRCRGARPAGCNAGCWRRTPGKREDGAVVLTRYADVTAAVRAERSHLTAAHPAIVADLNAAGVPVEADGLHVLNYFAWGQDPDGHARMIRVLAPWLAGKNISLLAADACEAARMLRPPCAPVHVVPFAKALASLVTERLTGIAAVSATLLLNEAEAFARRQGTDIFTRELDAGQRVPRPPSQGRSAAARRRAWPPTRLRRTTTAS